MTAWLLETFVAVSLLIGAVLLLRRPVARLFGAGWAYALWAIPAARLVLPPLPQLAETLPPVVIFIPAAGGGTAPLPAEAGPGQWVPFLLATWAGGAVIFLILQWLAYRAFVRRLDGRSRRGRPPFYQGVATFVSDAVDGPLALGLLRRRIVVPADFSRRYSEGERRLAMAHERTHHRHGDLWWNVAAIVVLALNWFNPLAWIAFRAFRADQELACDAAVAARASDRERHDYALALVKSASRPGLVAACSMNAAGALKWRLRMMRSHRASRARNAGGLAALTLLAAGGLSVALATASPERPVVYLARPASPPARPSHTPALPVAQAAAPVAAAVAAPRRQLARAVSRSPLAVPSRPRLDLALAGVEPRLEPLALQPMRLPRLRMAAYFAPEPRSAPLRVGTVRTATFVIRTSDDSAAADRVRVMIEEAISRGDDGETKVRLERIERVLGGAYVATIVNEPKMEGE
ncbi:MAG: hypothetical protein JOZ90_10805 [Alphaproteobacteria bacterium]|nr:hypothetical protein [Alphaproteobacteria bacterium]MBV9371052.1 hypothetical protein [Alphaproteobacteria bacterium]MBV9901574.1 hypothetical protein [Alphaproteobacteria bacterium]